MNIERKLNMLRYAIDDHCEFDVKFYNKSIAIVAATNNISTDIGCQTGIYFWPDEGSLLLVISNYSNSNTPYMVTEPEELIIDTSQYPGGKIRPGTVIAVLFPLATAYFGAIEAQEVQDTWFNYNLA